MAERVKLILDPSRVREKTARYNGVERILPLRTMSLDVAIAGAMSHLTNEYPVEGILDANSGAMVGAFMNFFERQPSWIDFTGEQPALQPAAVAQV